MKFVLIIAIVVTIGIMLPSVFAESITHLGGSIDEYSSYYKSTKITFDKYVITQGDGNFKILTVYGTAVPVKFDTKSGGPIGLFDPDRYYVKINGQDFDPSREPFIKKFQKGEKYYSYNGNIEWIWKDKPEPVNFELIFEVYNDVSRKSQIELYFSEILSIKFQPQYFDIPLGKLSQLDSPKMSLEDKKAAEKKEAEKKAADKKAADKKIADKKIADKKLADKKLAEDKLKPIKSFDLNSETCKTLKGTWDGWDECKMKNFELKSYEIMNIPSSVTMILPTDQIFKNFGEVAIKGKGLIVINGKLINNGKITISNTGVDAIGINSKGTLDNFGIITINNGGGNGININYGTINNSGVITIGNTDKISIGIYNLAGKIKNNLSSTITISNSNSIGIDNLGTVDNSGTITISNTGGYGINNHSDDSINYTLSLESKWIERHGITNHSTDSINNNVSGKIVINNTGGGGIKRSSGDEFTSEGIICGTSTNAFFPPMKLDKCK